MPEELQLADRIRLFAGWLFNHDYLWFSSSEISKVSTTVPVLHNYALCYALSFYERGVTVGSVATYEEDLSQMPLYATPALSQGFSSRTRITFNALDSVTLRTDLKPNVNTPDVGHRVYLDPVYERQERDSRRQGYLFYLFVFDGSQPRSIVRLGKKGCPVRIWWEEIRHKRAVFSRAGRRPSHVVNPLDVGGQILAYDPVALPPHMLLRSATIADDWFVDSGPHVIHVPARVSARLQAGLP